MISIVAMGAIISVIITTIVIYTAFQEVDENYLKVMKTFGAKKERSSVRSFYQQVFQR